MAKRTAIAPSPTAEADALHRSTADVTDRVDARADSSRASRAPADVVPVVSAPRPVPRHRSARTHARPARPASRHHWVRGSAPMNTNIASAGICTHFAGVTVLGDHRSKAVIADEVDHLGVRAHVDRRVTGDPVDEIPRHVLGEMRHPGRRGGPSRRGPPGTIAACPAELPPPTTTTSIPLHSRRSTDVAA